MKHPYHKQQNDYFCGPSAVQMILGAHGIKKTQARLGKMMGSVPFRGTRRRIMAKPLRANGFVVRMKAHASIDELDRLIRDGWHIIVNYIELGDDIGHFAVVTKVTPTHLVMHDPWHGANYRISRKTFLPRWMGGNRRKDQARWYLAAKPR